MRILLALFLGLAGGGCGSQAGSPDAPEPPESAPAGLVLKIEQLSGDHAQSPAALTLAVYGDGRVFRPDPQILIYPGPVLPTFSVSRISPERVESSVERVRASGVLDPAAVEDEPAPGTGTTIVTVLADGELRTARLRDGAAAAQRLQAALQGLPVGTQQPYAPHGLAAFAHPAKDPETDPDWLIEPHEPSVVAWPAGRLQPGCSVASGADAEQILAAASQAHELTRWRSGGSLYTVAFRPLLPGESSCADVSG